MSKMKYRKNGPKAKFNITKNRVAAMAIEISEANQKGEVWISMIETWPKLNAKKYLRFC